MQETCEGEASEAMGVEIVEVRVSSWAAGVDSELPLMRSQSTNLHNCETSDIASM